VWNGRRRKTGGQLFYNKTAHHTCGRNSLSRAGIHKYSIMAYIVGSNSNRQRESLLANSKLMRCQV